MSKRWLRARRRREYPDTCSTGWRSWPPRVRVKSNDDVESTESSGDIVAGNFGNGRINVFDEDGRFIDALDGADGKTLDIDG
jgi:hypothetical protein